MEKSILIGTSVYKKNQRQDLCIESLQRLSNQYTNIKCCLIQQQQDVVLYNDIICYRSLSRNSMSVLDTQKNIPFINDILDQMSEYSEDIFVYCNSDIILSPRLIDYIHSTDVEAFGVSRTDIYPTASLVDPLIIHRNEPAGFDCWVVSKKWWQNNRHKFYDFLIGRPYFDVMYTILMALNSNNTYVSDREIIFHAVHENSSYEKDECYLFNQNQKIRHYEYIEEIWKACGDNTYLQREDYGFFLRYLDNEQNIIKRIINYYKRNG